METMKKCLGIATLIGSFGINSAEMPHSHNKETLISNCIGKEDGSYWMKFSDLSDDFSAVNLECSNGYVILDPSRDENLKNYFSSWVMWHHSIAGPVNSNPVNWEEWFLGSFSDGYFDLTAKSQYIVSPSCDVCDETSSRQLGGTKTAYYMSGNLAKLFWINFGMPQCDMDYDSYECFSCDTCEGTSEVCDTTSLEDTDDMDAFGNSGLCATAPLVSNWEVPRQHIDAVGRGGLVYKPSIGTDGEFCVCYKPSEESSLSTIQYKATPKDLAIMSQANNKIEQAEEEDLNDQETNKKTKRNIVYLSQKDFDNGPVRILESGTYIITEDIVYDFGADHEYEYFPTIDEVDEYPGAGGYRDSWFMGYFAAMTVEADDVTIDLGGHTLKQSFEFYLQQRWFTHIELSSSQFLPGQGPGFFGSDPVFVKNFEVKNGVLGLSSHFGIHGNYPTGITITNVHIKDFGTHGIQLNGWEDLLMDDVEIGPSSEYEWLLGSYGHARLVLPRLKAILEDMKLEQRDGGRISIKNRYTNDKSMSMYDIIYNLEYEMNLAKNYALNRFTNQHAQNDYISPHLLDNAPQSKRWQAAKQQFIWEDGLPSATSIHGIFLNEHSVSVATFAISSDNLSKNAKLNNVKIHDIKHSFDEHVGIEISTTDVDDNGVESGLLSSQITPWNSMMDARAALGGKSKLMEYFNIALKNYNKEELGLNEDEMDNSWKDFDYVGSVLLDGYLAMNYFSDSWDYLALLAVSPDFEDWTQGLADTPEFEFTCNQDYMTHGGKGLIGLRMDAVENVEITNLQIYNLYDKTPLGLDVCGPYESPTADNFDSPGAGGLPKQIAPMQLGFSGNNVRAVSIVGSNNIDFYDNFLVHNLNSDYGEVAALALWPNCEDITVHSGANVVVSNIAAGIELTDKYVNEHFMDYQSRPNRLPEACALRLETKGDYVTELNVEDKENSRIIACNIDARVGCLGNDFYTQYGIYQDEASACLEENVVGLVEPDKKEDKKYTASKNERSQTWILVISIAVVVVIIGLIMYCQYRGIDNNNNTKIEKIKDDNVSETEKQRLVPITNENNDNNNKQDIGQYGSVQIVQEL